MEDLTAPIFGLSPENNKTRAKVMDIGRLESLSWPKTEKQPLPPQKDVIPVLLGQHWLHFWLN